jgi:hypothetical protein
LANLETALFVFSFYLFSVSAMLRSGIKSSATHFIFGLASLLECEMSDSEESGMGSIPSAAPYAQ